MIFDNLYLAGCAAWLPPAVPAAAEVAAGRCTEEDVSRTGIVSVTVATGEPPAELAARAATIALERSGCPAEDVGLVLHATLYDQGHDLWGSASYVQRVAVGARQQSAPAVEVRQVSNGGMASMSLAAAYLRAGTDRPAALLSTGDVFCLPGFDRWRSDPGTVYADGGTAMVLSRRGGFARLLGQVDISEPRLEGMHRGGASFEPAPDGRRRLVDLDRCKREYLTEVDRVAAVALVAAGQRQAVTELLDELNLGMSDINRLVLPHLGIRRLRASFLVPFGIDPERTTWSWSRSVGHLGAGDQFAGLAHLIETRQLAEGELCLLAGVGAGFSWSCAVVEVLQLPDWT